MSSWAETDMDDALQKNNFTHLMGNSGLYYYMDYEREMETVEWCYTHGFEEQNAPILYMWLRNSIKPSVGNVCDKYRFQRSLLGTVTLLMRVAQDEEVCRRILAQKNLVAYNVLREKLNHWLEKFKGKPWPSLRDIVSQVADADPLPSPAWVTQCSRGGYRSVYFYTPDDSLVASAKENQEKVNATRSEVRKEFLAWAQERTWVEFLSQNFILGAP